MLHIKLTGMKHRKPCKQLFCPFTHPQPLGGGQKVKTFIFEGGHVAYQIKGKEVQNIMQVKYLTICTPLTF